MRIIYFLIALLAGTFLKAQDPGKKLSSAMKALEGDEQFKHAILSLYVVDGKTGRTIYEKNAQAGLAPASCQKVITSTAAFELLGKNYTYKTPVRLYRSADSARIFITGSGDPTLGSWRWNYTTTGYIIKEIQKALQQSGILFLGCDITVDENKFPGQPVPDGWIWQDIGNYYGAGAWAFNCRENQYDLILRSGKFPGDTTGIAGFNPSSARIPITNYITAGKKGSGDNAYIYAAPYSNTAYAAGTIPPAQEKFVISGSLTYPAEFFIRELKTGLNAAGIAISDGSNISFLLQGRQTGAYETIHTITSPTLDSINYWFLKKSINLYGEVLVKTIAAEKTKSGSADTGIAIIKDFWSKRGIERSALNIIDGSGLSPANRVTTNALVAIMQYAKNQEWFSSFYNALPEMNGIKMKDGYINGVRSFTGYVKSRTGNEYTFSFIVNNFYGSAGTVREKMWKVLDILK